MISYSCNPLDCAFSDSCNPLDSWSMIGVVLLVARSMIRVRLRASSYNQEDWRSKACPEPVEGFVSDVAHRRIIKKIGGQMLALSLSKGSCLTSRIVV